MFLPLALTAGRTFTKLCKVYLKTWATVVRPVMLEALVTSADLEAWRLFLPRSC